MPQRSPPFLKLGWPLPGPGWLDDRGRLSFRRHIRRRATNLAAPGCTRSDCKSSHSSGVTPGVVLEVTAFKVHGYIQPDGLLIMPEDLRCRYELGAENMQLRTDELLISSHEIALAVFPSRSYGESPQPAS